LAVGRNACTTKKAAEVVGTGERVATPAFFVETGKVFIEIGVMSAGEMSLVVEVSAEGGVL
jgi:hypothetical protein